jgi:uncharacterized protein
MPQHVRGSPQWQIEALRRFDIPEDMQKQYAFAPLGDANSTTKQLIFAGNAIQPYKIRLKAADNTRMPSRRSNQTAASAAICGSATIGRTSGRRPRASS